MNAETFVSDMEARGLSLQYEGDGLVIECEAGASAPTPRERDLLQTLKADIIMTLRTRSLGADWSRVSLWKLDRVLEVAVPWSDIRLVIAPGCRIARELRSSDPKPGRIWCVCEVLDLLLSGVRPEDARSIAQTRLTFDADLVGVRREQP